jgi:hypothetical protein
MVKTPRLLSPTGLAVMFACFALSAAWAFRQQVGPRDGAETITVTVVAVEAPARVGDLDVIAITEWTSADARFGGWSDMRVDARGRLIAISDQGHWLGLAKPAVSPGKQPAEFGVLRDSLGRPLPTKHDADAEGLALLADGRALVSFEGQHRLDYYDIPARGFMAAAAPGPALVGLNALGGNSGLEGLALLPDGRLIAGAESGEIWVFSLDTGAPHSRLLRQALPLGWMTTALAAADDTLFVLWRFFNPLNRELAVEVRTCPIAGLAARRLACTRIAALQAPFPTDNFEGLDVVRISARDAPPVYEVRLLSDNNFNRDQRTLYARFRYTPR